MSLDLCPACRHEVHLRDMGFLMVNGEPRNVLVCSKCGAWVERITVLRTLPKTTERMIKAGH